ncbi:MAG: PASTA domain-containing protein, partial [Bacteroidaceae bacterium]
KLRGLIIQVNDSGFVRAAPANSVLEQSIEAGTKVKKGRTIYITINSTNTPTLVVPDVADNCSMREAQTKLKAIGFNLDEVEYINGEKDWVYEIKHNGTILSAGSRVPVDARITLVVGNGMVETEEEDSTAVNDYPIDAGLTDEENTIGNE